LKETRENLGLGGESLDWVRVPIFNGIHGKGFIRETGIEDSNFEIITNMNFEELSFGIPKREQGRDFKLRSMAQLRLNTQRTKFSQLGFL
jgi:hypothetical protein